MRIIFIPDSSCHRSESVNYIYGLLYLSNGCRKHSLKGATIDTPRKPPPCSPILDNHPATLGDYLLEHLDDAKKFRIVSAYFSVFGFEVLADKLYPKDHPHVQFLFGGPESVGNIAKGEMSRRKFELTDEGLSNIDSVLHQRSSARLCAEWVKQDHVEVRKISRPNFLHGKMYHIESEGESVATVGSSNLTLSGLGKARNPNIEINYAVPNAKDRDEFSRWFDKLWENDEWTVDAKEEMLNALERWIKEYSPEFIYYKSLFELFRKEIDSFQDEQIDHSNLEDFSIWQSLYDFQKTGAKLAIHRLLQHNGCILADSVGLGKTYTALAVIKYFELRNQDILVLCPKRLENNWRIFNSNDINDPLRNGPGKKNRFNFKLLAHTDLDHDEGMRGNINLKSHHWGAYDLLVIDESHNFRNARNRYNKLMEKVIQSGARTKVLMLSATPVNTSLIDLQNQVGLMAEDDAFAESLGIRSIKEACKRAQSKFHEWSQNAPGQRMEEPLLNNLGDDFLRLLNGTTIARSRQQIRESYGQFIEDEGDFPKRETPQNEFPHTDKNGELSYEELYNDLKELKFHLYRPSDYLTENADKNKQRQEEASLTEMMRINFLKRLESSAEACRATLARTLEKVEERIKKAEKFLKEHVDGVIESDVIDEDNEDEDVVNTRSGETYRLKDMEVERWKTDLEKDQIALKEALKKVERIKPERDGKLDLLKEHVREKSGEPNRKLLVFTAFKDTAEYLFEHLKEVAKELNLNMECVSGKTEGSQFIRILDHFSPKARKCKRPGTEEIDLLIATDCISEGQNLQDCDTVLNYDIHWNPVRLIQRFGRIDRLGSENESVRMINYWPTEDMDAYLNLENRVHARTALINVTSGSEHNLHEVKQMAEEDLDIKNKQLKKLMDEVLDLEDLEGSVSMSDLTLNHFMTQLLDYLQQNRKKLEEAPPGIYGVISTAGVEQPLANGAIFLFRHTNDNQNVTYSPKHPFYIVHVEEGGKVRQGYMQIHSILKTFQALALGEDEPARQLCDTFTREIDSPAGKEYYNQLLGTAIQSIQRTYRRKSQEHLTDRHALIPKQGEIPSEENLQLVTWLIIKKKETPD